MSFWVVFAIRIISYLSIVRHKGTDSMSSKMFMFEFGTVYVCTQICPMPTCGGPKKLFPNTHFCCSGHFFLSLHSCYLRLPSKVCFSFRTHYTHHFACDLFFFSWENITFSSLAALGIPWFVSWQAMIISMCRLFQLSWEVHGDRADI